MSNYVRAMNEDFGENTEVRIIDMRNEIEKVLEAMRNDINDGVIGVVVINPIHIQIKQS